MSLTEGIGVFCFFVADFTVVGGPVFPCLSAALVTFGVSTLGSTESLLVVREPSDRRSVTTLLPDVARGGTFSYERRKININKLWKNNICKRTISYEKVKKS